MIPQLYRVERRQEEFPGTFTLQLAADRGSASAFRPGQFNMLYAFGAGEVAISMSGSPLTEPLVHTIRTHGLVTRALQQLRVGDSVGVRGPFGCGWPLDRIAGRELLIVAGGLGLAPLRPVIYSLLESDAQSASVRLFYGARRPQELLYGAELQNWSKSMELVTAVDHAGGDWSGRVGVITDPLAAAEFTPDRTIAFLCGPEIMMRFCIQTLLAKGLSPADIYLSMERNMKCATGLCGHCQWGPNFVCKDGPVFRYQDVQPWFQIRAL
ncbi:FAD/NAD(P)-binding protein [Microbulbifer sp. SAOS-129_SWC]|uniref:FAD/NAD(P)-binding protein n=1 Tax=Microbulbifer sp. SAOS-129_SWC TaxID=3145235 RepID=UPI003216A25C